MLQQRLEAKYARKKVRLNQVSNSQPPGHESDMLTTTPPRRGDNFRVAQILQFVFDWEENSANQHILLFPYCLSLSQTSPGFYVSAVQVF